jgi:hypothetical protein
MDSGLICVCKNRCRNEIAKMAAMQNAVQKPFAENYANAVYCADNKYCA